MLEYESLTKTLDNKRAYFSTIDVHVNICHSSTGERQKHGPEPEQQWIHKWSLHVINNPLSAVSIVRGEKYIVLEERTLSWNLVCEE